VAGTQQPTTHQGKFAHLFIALSIEDADIALQYDRVDPTEFQSLKDELEVMRTEKSALESQQTTQAGELTQLQEKVGDIFVGCC